jgi:hypothetical protein
MLPASYCFGTLGSARFMRAVADAIEDSQIFIYDTQHWSEDREFFEGVVHLEQDRAIKAMPMGEMVGVFSSFMAGYASKKFLDEVYDRTLKRPLGKFLDRLLGPGSPVENKKVEIRDVVYLKDIDTVVVVRAVVEKQNAAQVAGLFLQGHRVANAFLAARGRCAPVHCHVISDGAVSIEPALYLTLEHLNREIKSS